MSAAPLGRGRYETFPVVCKQGEYFSEALSRVIEGINQRNDTIIAIVDRPDRHSGPHVMIIVERYMPRVHP